MQIIQHQNEDISILLAFPFILWQLTNSCGGHLTCCGGCQEESNVSKFVDNLTVGYLEVDIET
jgi:hypothetical protein